jgi:hypothetical protein
MSDNFSYEVFPGHDSKDNSRVQQLKPAELCAWFDERIIKPRDFIQDLI